MDDVLVERQALYS